MMRKATVALLLLNSNAIASGNVVVQVETQEDLIAYTRYNAGVELEGNLKLWEASKEYESALAIKPNLLEAINNLGGICSQQHNHECAEEQYTKLLKISIREGNKNMESVALNNLGLFHARNGKLTGITRRHDLLEKAISYYDAALSINQGFTDALYNKGNALFALGDLSGSLSIFKEILRTDPSHCGALLNLGNIYLTLANTTMSHQLHLAASQHCSPSTMKRGQEALSARNNLGMSLRESGDYHEAIKAHQSALELDNSDATATIQLAVLFRHLCDWTSWSDITQQALEVVHHYVIQSETSRELPPISAYESLFLPDLFGNSSAKQSTGDAGLLSTIAQFAVQRYETDLPAEEEFQAQLLAKPPGSSVHIAYISYDMGNHPMGHLTHGLLRHHHREMFNISVFSYGINDKSEQRNRLETSADSFFDVFAQPDSIIASSIREQSVDVLIDLMGHTTGTRIGILAESPAPVVLTYLGYPGSFGSLKRSLPQQQVRRALSQFSIADRFVLPAEHVREEFAESVIYLPYTYQANDYSETSLLCHRGLGEQHFVQCRKSLSSKYNIKTTGHSIVFCNFNGHAKFEPHSFSLWMTVLTKVPSSIMLLLQPKGKSSDSIMWNIRQEAARRGVDPARLEFLPRVSKEEHLERQQIADLFLDSVVYGAHSTGSDALWGGIPLITLRGNVFSARVGWSLMSNVGVGSLVATSDQEYIDLAVELASNSLRLAAVHMFLAESLMNKFGAFDTHSRSFDIEASAKVSMDLVSLAIDHHVILAPTGESSQYDCLESIGGITNRLVTETNLRQNSLAVDITQARDAAERCLMSSWFRIRSGNSGEEVGELLHQLGLRYFIDGDPMRGSWVVSLGKSIFPHHLIQGNLAQLLLSIGESTQALQVLIASLSNLEAVPDSDVSYVCANIDALVHQIAIGNRGRNPVLLLERSANFAVSKGCPIRSSSILFSVLSDVIRTSSQDHDALESSLIALEKATLIDPSNFANRYKLGTLQNQAGKHATSLATHLNVVREENLRNFVEWTNQYGRNNLILSKKPRLAIYCYEYGQTWWPNWGPRSPDIGGAGGSEEAVIFLARELTRYFSVEVFADPPEQDLGQDEYGVWWRSYKSFDSNLDWDVFVAWRYHISLALSARAKRRYLWLQDMIDRLAPQYEANPAFVQEITGVFSLSRFHIAALPHSLQAKSIVTPNALDPKYLVDGPNSATRFIYASAPNRGLEQILTVWHRIRDAIPSATLEVYYGFSDSFVKWAKSTMGNYAVWHERMQQLLEQPGVVYIGMVDHAQLAVALSNAGYYLYPTSFPETGCVSLMKAQAMGAIPITSRYSESTLPELCGQWDLGPESMIGEKISDHHEWLDRWTQSVISASLDEQAENQGVGSLGIDQGRIGRHRSAMKKWARATLLWSSVAKQWRDIISLNDTA